MSSTKPPQVAPLATKPKPGRPPAWPVIRRRKNRAGVSWRVDAGRFNGPARLVRQFKTREEADAYADDLRAQREEAKETASFERKHRAVKLTHLTDEQRADALAAFRVLEGTRGTLKHAAEFWRAHAAPADARTVKQVHAELIEAATLANRRPRTVYELKNRLAPFVEEFGKIPVASITTPDADAWLTAHTRKLTPRTRGAYRRVLHRLFSFAVKRQYREGNPVAAIDAPHAGETQPEILTPAQVRKLLDTAAMPGLHKDESEQAATIRRALVPWLAIGFFAGLRTAELDGLDWRSIDLKQRTIRVDAATAKKRRTRYVKIEPNLLSWLAPYQQGEGRVFYSRRALRTVQELAKVSIPHNGARHSFGSYHLAAFEDAGRTAAQMGHAGDTATLFNHYRALVRPADARAYWKVRPTPQDTGRVIEFPKAATA